MVWSQKLVVGSISAAVASHVVQEVAHVPRERLQLHTEADSNGYAGPSPFGRSRMDFSGTVASGVPIPALAYSGGSAFVWVVPG
jgi:hypothetical protein